MSRSKSSEQWLRAHFTDPYVKKSKQEGYRSRASYKLIELDEQNKIFKKGQKVIDLGAAPGGWSQVVAKRVGKEGTVIATDILPMKPLSGVAFVQGDFTTQEVVDKLNYILADRKLDLVISDIAPNMSGISAIDQPRAMYLCELALDFARLHLREQGAMLYKVFQGEGFDALLKETRAVFRSVAVRKPKSSKPRSRELYLWAKGFTVGK